MLHGATPGSQLVSPFQSRNPLLALLRAWWVLFHGGERLPRCHRHPSRWQRVHWLQLFAWRNGCGGESASVLAAHGLDLGWASANIQPQKVPLDMVPAADPAASDNVHMPIPLASAWAALAPRAPSIRNQDEDEHDLAEAIRLSLTPAPAPAVSERPKSGKEQLEKRTKDLFELYRSQGVAPHEAAQRAAAQARRETAG